MTAKEYLSEEQYKRFKATKGTKIDSSDIIDILGCASDVDKIVELFDKYHRSCSKRMFATVMHDMDILANSGSAKGLSAYTIKRMK